MARAVAVLVIVFGASACGARTGLELPSEEDKTPPVCRPFGPADPAACTPALADATPRALPLDGVRAVLAPSCDLVIVASTAFALVSSDGGATFGDPIALPEGVVVPTSYPASEGIAARADGALLVLVRRNEGVFLDRFEDGAWGEARTSDAPQESIVFPSLLVRGSDVVVWWRGPGIGGGEAMNQGLMAARSGDGGRTFGAAERIDGAVDSSMVSSGSVCLAGRDGLVVSTMQCDGSDCAGADANSTHRIGVVALSEGGADETVQLLFTRDNDFYGSAPQPVVGCRPDGSVLAAFTTNTGAVRTALPALCDEDGSLAPADTWDGDGGVLEPFYPEIVPADDLALVFWQSGAGATELAFVDRDGHYVTEPISVDRDGDAFGGRLATACPVGPRTFIGLVSRFAPNAVEGTLEAVRIAPDSSTPDRVELGSVDEGSFVACDGRGRAHIAWASGGQVHYVSMGAE